VGIEAKVARRVERMRDDNLPVAGSHDAQGSS
jgi:hypothetical protein